MNRDGPNADAGSGCFRPLLNRGHDENEVLGDDLIETQEQRRADYAGLFRREGGGKSSAEWQLGNSHTMTRDGRGLGEAAADANDIVTLGGTLLTHGSNGKANNAFAMSEEAKTPGLELKDQGSTSRGGDGKGSGGGQERQGPDAEVDSSANDAAGSPNDHGHQYNQDSHRVQRDQVLSFKDLNQYADRSENHYGVRH